MANETLTIWSGGAIDSHRVGPRHRLRGPRAPPARRRDHRRRQAGNSLIDEADPRGIVRSARGSGPSLSAAILGNAGKTTASPTSPACAPSPALSPRSTSPDWWAARGHHQGGRCRFASGPLSRSRSRSGHRPHSRPALLPTRHGRGQTSQPVRCAESQPSSSPGSPPVARRGTSGHVTKTGPPPRPRARLPAQTASRSTPKSDAARRRNTPAKVLKNGRRVEAERSRPRRCAPQPTATRRS